MAANYDHEHGACERYADGIAADLEGRRDKTRAAVEILEREFGHGDAQHNAPALEALALLREAVK